MITPERIFQTLTAYQASQALAAAIKLDLFTVISSGNETAAKISKACDASERGIRILCDYLCIMEFLVKEEGKYALGEEAKVFLDRKSPAYMGSISVFLNSETLTRSFENLDRIVKEGKTQLPGEGTVETENLVWVDFAKGMAPMMAPPAQEIAKLMRISRDASLKVLDIAAGHGIYGIAFAKEFPNSTVTALDWKSVLTVAKENAERAEVIERYKLLPGDAFTTELTEEYDVILLPNFLHHFDQETCKKFLRKMYSSLKTGGLALTIEFVPNEDRISPPAEAAFSLVMLASTVGGDAYTFSELDAMFKSAGFNKSESHKLESSPEHLIISHKS
jgi:ubiquinone/menaquinone biosynthesis C-methylase UbiE